MTLLIELSGAACAPDSLSLFPCQYLQVTVRPFDDRAVKSLRLDATGNIASSSEDALSLELYVIKDNPGLSVNPVPGNAPELKAIASLCPITFPAFVSGDDTDTWFNDVYNSIGGCSAVRVGRNDALPVDCMEIRSEDEVDVLGYENCPYDIVVGLRTTDNGETSCSSSSPCFSMDTVGSTFFNV